MIDKDKRCCGCGVCIEICPQNAIEFEKDEDGRSYPKVNETKCVRCGLCQKKCMIRKEKKKNEMQLCYAASMKDEKEILQSASGGIFTEIAKLIIDNGGVVYGSSLMYLDEKIIVKHIRVENKDDLIKIKGSKYVQSEISSCLYLIKDDLLNGIKVLFSGTPCQIAALKQFLGKNYDNLLTIDVICHGVPENNLFYDYISILEEKYKGKIIDFKFRDKKMDGLSGSIKLNKKGKIKYKKIIVPLSSYYKLFYQADIFRESCYECEFAGENRISDITLGDYWGIGIEHSEYLKKNGGNLDEKWGISCIIVNSQQGYNILELIKNNINIYESEFYKIANHNMQLKKPSEYGKNYQLICKMLKDNNGCYDEIDVWYNNKIRFKKIIFYFASIISPKIKEKIKIIINKKSR